MRKVLISILLCSLAGCGASEVSVFPDDRVLVIADAMKVGALEVTAGDVGTTRRLFQIYEPLVKTDATFKKIPGLAESWGSPSEVETIFHIKPGVKFHNGDSMTLDDIIMSFNNAQNSESSQIKDLLSNLEIAKIGEDRIKITSPKPDPTLLEKVSKVLIVPSDPAKRKYGTGAYMLIEKKKDQVVLEAFDQYHGGDLAAQSVVMQSMTNKQLRSKNIKAQNIDILLDTPPEVQGGSAGYEVERLPALDPVFMMFKAQKDNSPLKDPRIREVINLAIDRSRFRSISPYTIPVNQFLSAAVFGYNPKLKEVEVNYTKALEKLKETKYPNGFAMEIVAGKSSEPLVKLLQSTLAKAKIKIIPKLIDPQDLQKEIERPSTEAFLVGWQFKSADSAGFFYDFFHSEGSLNLIGFADEEVDELIENAQVNIKPKQRLEILQKISGIMDNEKVGVPLFETSRTYLMKDDIQWQPRLDGNIEIKNVTPKL